MVQREIDQIAQAEVKQRELRALRLKVNAEKQHQEFKEKQLAEARERLRQLQDYEELAQIEEMVRDGQQNAVSASQAAAVSQAKRLAGIEDDAARSVLAKHGALVPSMYETSTPLGTSRGSIVPFTGQPRQPQPSGPELVNQVAERQQLRRRMDQIRDREHEAASFYQQWETQISRSHQLDDRRSPARGSVYPPANPTYPPAASSSSQRTLDVIMAADAARRESHRTYLANKIATNSHYSYPQ
mmetsp:Transcript_55174/g.130329  ORF Transcript_55174/g.130329 Transcript_55174/m.130329 type:complete len:243 (-) Transcript_55174:32-760(-)